MPGYANEPSILDRVALETRSGADWLSHPAMVANLTASEVWLGVQEPMVGLVAPADEARITLRLPDGGEVVSPSSVLRLIGADGRVVALGRPSSWRTPSRRSNARVALAIPAYLRPPDSAVVAARTTNIGVGGFHCVADLPIAVGHQMPVSLFLTPVNSFDCKAQVVRLEDHPDGPHGSRCVIAFRFIDLSDEEEATIASALLALADEADAMSAPLAWHSDTPAGAA